MTRNKMNKSTAGKGKSPRRGRGGNRNAKTFLKEEPNNYQDAAAIRERNKGAKSRKFEGECIVDRSNHPQWYFKDANTLRDVASFAYGRPLGTDIRNDLMLPPNGDAYPTGAVTSIPGVMGIKIGITPGVATNAQDPINLGAQNVYSFIRYKNSGAANYDAPDLMMYLIAIDSLYAAWNWMKRIYGYASVYSQVNRYKPLAYAKIDGVDLNDIYANLADFRAYLNMAAPRIASFCAPATFTYNVRHSWLFSNIFKDSDTDKAQEYMYTPAYFYEFAEVVSTQGTSLVPVNIATGIDPGANGLWTFNKLRAMLDSMINSMQYSEDAGIMSGDILKAYERGGLFTLSTFEPDYVVESVFDKQVLSQIENCRITSIFDSEAALGSMNITQDVNTNFIKFQPQIKTQITPRNGVFMNFHWNDPTPEDVIEATRLIATYKQVGDNVVLTNCGSEIALNTYVAYFSQEPAANFASNAAAQKIQSLNLIELRSGIDITEQPNLTAISLFLWNSFDWAPPIVLRVTIGSNQYYIPEMRDWDIYTSLDNQDIEALNLLALLSEFNVPN